MTDPRFSIIPAGAVLDQSLEARDLQVLCLFGRHIDRKGWCRRSQVQMAKEIGCARSTVQASIDRLIEAGWLQKRAEKELHAPGSRDAAYEYRVVLDHPDEALDIVGTPADLSAPPADLDRHPLPTQASAPKLLTSPLNGKKEGRFASDPTEKTVDINRHIHPELFAACVALTEPVKAFVEHKHFPASVVAQAKGLH